jgi:hypothetical protein
VQNKVLTEIDNLINVLELRNKGGEGSGNFGHAGRPGEVGGSGPGGGSSGSEWYSSLSDGEKGSISAWQGKKSHDIREAERGKGDAESQELAETFNQALDKDGNFEGTTYRGIDASEKHFDSLQGADEITLNSSTSATTDIRVASEFAGSHQPDVERPIVMEIHGKTGVDISSIVPEGHPNEKEVILRKGTIYHVDSFARDYSVGYYKMVMTEK